MSTTLPENNTKINIKLFLLDPLSVIIKLAILGNKPIGTKVSIQNNILYLQEPGIFQALCRLIYNSNKILFGVSFHNQQYKYLSLIIL